MKLDSLFEAQDDDLYDPIDDTTSYTLKDTRRQVLTLKHLNKLRKYRAFKEREMDFRDAIVAMVYQQQDEPQQGGLGL